MAAKPKPLYKLPNISPRGPEVQRIVEILESGEFDNATQMARKVLSTALDVLLQRDWYAVASRDPSTPRFVTHYGFFATEGAAVKAIETNALGLLGDAGPITVRSLPGHLDDLNRLDPAPSQCANCGHADYAHAWPMPVQGRQKYTGATYDRCVAGQPQGRMCGCSRFVRRDGLFGDLEI